MKKQIAIRMLALLLAVLFIVPIASCGKKDENKEKEETFIAKDMKIGDQALSNVRIVYSGNDEDKAVNAADKLAAYVKEYAGVEMKTVSFAGAGEIGTDIVIGNTDLSADLTAKLKGILDYSVNFVDGKLLVCGTNEWALLGAVEQLKNDFISKGTDIPADYAVTGSAMGLQISERTKGSNFRIMTNNVWDRDKNCNKWAAIGENCSAEVRSVGFASVYMAYRPDVINFQEMSVLMISEIQKNMDNCGVHYELLYKDRLEAGDTCILYNPETVELLDSGNHAYTYGNNKNSKGYTWGYFKHKESGEFFCTISSHLWFKSDTSEPGSSEMRRKQSLEIVAIATELKDKYNCPVFFQGDLNMNTKEPGYVALLSGGFEDNYVLSKVYKDNIRGTHACSDNGFSLELDKGDYTDGAIDHMLVMNKGDAEFFTFNHVNIDFYFKLSDHLPLYTDVKLGK